MHETPPLSSAALTFHLPAVEDAALADGTPLYVVRKPGEDLVTISLYIERGSAHDEVPGATAFAGELLTRGTQRLNFEQVAEEIDGLGASIRSGTDRASFRFSALSVESTLTELVQLMAECLLQPRFNQQELQALREQWIGEALMDLHEPMYLADQALTRVTFGNHPYAKRPRGSIANMRRIQVEHIVEAHRRLLQSPRTLIVAGPCSAEEVVPILNAAFSALPAVTRNDDVAHHELTGHSGCLAVNPEAVQTALWVSLPSPHLKDPDYPATLLATTVLGGYTLARMFMVLREEKGYTYGAYAQNVTWKHFASIDLTTSVGNAVTADTMQAIDRLVREMGTTPIGSDELENARQHLLGSLARSNETPQQAAGLLWKVIQHGLPRTYYPDLIEHLQQLTAEDLLAVQQRWFDADRWVIGASGLPDVVLPAIERYVTSVEVWNGLAEEAE